LVPSTVDPATLSFTASGGATDPSHNSLDYPLFDINGVPFGPANTALGTGQVVGIPIFNWALFSIDGRANTAVLPAGTYNIGIACADAAGVADVFWNVRETFSVSTTDPNGEVWQAANAPACPNWSFDPCDAVNPAINLHDGQSVTVTYESFPMNVSTTVYIKQCTPYNGTTVTCSNFGVTTGTLTHPTPGDPTNGRGGSATYVAHTLPNPAQPNDITCDDTHACSIVVSTTPTGGPPGNPYWDQAKITFASTPPVNVPESPWAILLPLSALPLGLVAFSRQRRKLS
jgi:hypothetical protein